MCFAVTPSTTAKLELNADNKSIKLDNIEIIANPYDEWYSIVRAVELRQITGGEVILFTVAEAKYDSIIRKCLALGADICIRVNASPLNHMFVANQLKEVIKNENIDVLFTGKETIDYQGGIVGSIIAGFLDVPFIFGVSKIDYANGKFILERDLPGKIEVIEITPPFVLSSTKGMADQKIPPISEVLKARTKPIKVVEPISVSDPIQIEKIDLSAKEKACKFFTIDEIDKFIDEVIKEKKIIPI